MVKGKSIRRHNNDKFKKRVIREEMHTGGGIKPLTNRIIGIASKTPTRCSMYCCGNPRKWDNELTLQERKNNDSFESVIY